MRPWVPALLLAFSLSFALHAQQTLYNFESPAEPTSSLVDGGDGFFYGTAARAGSAGKGIVYKVDLTTGQWTTVVTFNGGNGAFPYGDVLVQGQFLYGTTYQGGTYDLGTVYRIDRTTGTLTTLQHLGNDGVYPRAGLVAYGSELYGTTSDGGQGGFGGSIFKINPVTGVLTTLASFSTTSSVTGSMPISPLLVVGSGLYGTTFLNHSGPVTVYRFDPATLKLAAVGSIGGPSYSGLVSTGSALYGTSSLSAFSGSLFKVDLATGAVSTVYDFDLTHGGPTGGLVYDGTYLYGTTERSTTTAGTVFRFDPASGTATTLSVFNVDHGYAPRAALLVRNGALYGTTTGGGPNNGGTIFKVELATGALTALSFFNHDGTGATSWATPIIDGGVLYGTTVEGGRLGVGTVYKMDLSTGSVSTVASFTGPTGGNPGSGLIMKDGKLYGTTQRFGPSNGGTAYSVDPATGTLTVIGAFDLNKDAGGFPQAPLTAVGPYLYGTASSGGTGAGGAGTVFRVDPATKTLTSVYKFPTPPVNGASPYSPLLLYHGLLYGTTYAGGSSGRGTVFRIDPSNDTFTSVASLAVTGTNPNSGLTPLGSFLYGTTLSSSSVYKVNPDTGAISTVATLIGAKGQYPGSGGLVTDGTSLFGTTQKGGAYDHGTVFQLDPSTGKVTPLVSFDITNGDAPYGGLFLDGSYLYGTTQYGGTRGGGTLFRVAIPRPKTRAIGRR